MDSSGGPQSRGVQAAARLSALLAQGLGPRLRPPAAAAPAPAPAPASLRPHVLTRRPGPRCRLQRPPGPARRLRPLPTARGPHRAARPAPAPSAPPGTPPPPPRTHRRLASLEARHRILIGERRGGDGERQPSESRANQQKLGPLGGLLLRVGRGLGRGLGAGGGTLSWACLRLGGRDAILGGASARWAGRCPGRVLGSGGGTLPWACLRFGGRDAVLGGASARWAWRGSAGTRSLRLAGARQL